MSRLSREARRRGLVLSSLLVFVITGAACRRPGERQEAAPPGLFVINAPATGEVRRVIANEGAEVSEGEVVVELAVAVGPAGPGSREDPAARARTSARAARGEAAAAEAEVGRAAVEVQRVESLVTTGAAPQAQLDAARAQYQKAQERLGQLRETAQSAQDHLVLQEGGARTTPGAAAPPARIVTVRAPAAGQVRAISIRPGQRVTNGQPLATLSTKAR